MSAPIDVIVILTPKAGKADRVEELLRKCAASVQEKEPGTLRYQINREIQGDKPVIVMLETYKDVEATQVHTQSDYFKALGKAVMEEELLAEPMRKIVTKVAGGYATKL